MSRKYTSVGDIKGCVPLSRVIGETPDSSEYLVYDCVWYENNVGLGPQYPGRWLNVVDHHGILTCYNIINQNDHVISRSSI